ncbi:MAG: hypothetical protein AB7O65_09280 [Candidatus Korobacteraceae bacterium]
MSTRKGQRLVIGIAGRIGSGKTSVARHLEAAYAFQYIRYSEVLAEWRKADPGSKARLQSVGWDVMSGGLQVELNRRLIVRIKADIDCAVDGLRHPVDYDSLNMQFAPCFRLLYLDCPIETRWGHVKGRPGQTFDQFKAADSAPVEQRIDELKPLAYKAILNTGTLEDLYLTVDQVLAELRNARSL